jgi:Mn2+/Fe2+ NRAMP family transporter
MLEKTGILFVILSLLLVFYLVIRLGAGKKKDIAKSQEITNYLSGVRILIIILAIVALILWFFLN